VPTVGWINDKISKLLIRHLSASVKGYEPFSVTSSDVLRTTLLPGDVLLIEGNQRFSVAIKYLTQSTWSHSAMYVGDIGGTLNTDKKSHMLIEADIKNGVHAVPLSYYDGFNTRICRPVGLQEDDLKRVVSFMVDSVGMGYDLKNVIDLARYLVSMPPVPIRWRRRMLSMGSGDPTRAICSTRIAQAFQSVRYPILPHVKVTAKYKTGEYQHSIQEILHIRHHSLFTPRDFDLSPYFEIVKPTIKNNFDYKELVWSD
jgi:hypothetical protein